jgi:hypothetical protein
VLSQQQGFLKEDIRLLVLEISNKGFWLSAQLYG